MICDNIRPYVDHDFPLDGAGLARHRFAALEQPDFKRAIDHSGSFKTPLNKEVARRGRLAANAKAAAARPKAGL